MKTMKLVLVFLLFGSCMHLFAQYEYPGEQNGNDTIKKKSKYASSKIFLGGNFGLWFGNVTSIELDPIIGYMFTPRLSAGGGPMFMYYKEYDYYETTIYGGKIFGQFTVFKDLNKTIHINLGDIFIYGENEFLNIEPVYYYPIPNVYQKDSRRWIDVTLIGFGMRYPIGQKGGVSLQVLWDISQNPYYAYQNPEIRLGFSF
jgi:hypothetical protein